MWAIAYAWQDRFAVFEIRQHTVVVFHVSVLLLLLLLLEFSTELRFKCTHAGSGSQLELLLRTAFKCEPNASNAEIF